MKLSCIPVSYFNEIIKDRKTIYGWACEAGEIGFDYFDLSIIFFKRQDIDYFYNIKKKLDAANIGIAIINSYTDFTHPSFKVRKNELARLKEYIAAAEILGAEYMRVTAGQAHPETSVKKGIRWAVECLEKAFGYIKNTRVKLLFENHSKPGIWDYPDFSFSTGVFLEVFRQIKDMPVKVLFDTANTIAYGDDPLILLEKVIDDVACIHAADIKSRGSFEPVVIGTGIVPFREIFKELKDYGFKGIISIEEASGTGRKGIEVAYKYIKSLWQDKK
jgi:sugar phosphate isomerase/epimerase